MHHDIYVVTKLKKQAIYLLLSLICFIFILCFLPFSRVWTVQGIFKQEQEGCYVHFIVMDEMPISILDTPLMIDQKKISYEIINIVSEVGYQEVILKVDLESVDNMNLDLHFILPKQSITERLFFLLKEGFA